MVESFFTPEELDPAKEAIGELVESLANKLYNAGKITSKLTMSVMSHCCTVYVSLLSDQFQ